MITSRRVRIGDWIVVLLCVVIILVCVLPIIHITARSLSSAESLIRSEVTFWPKGLSFDAYRYILSDGKFTWALIWTAILTVLGTTLSLIMTTMCAYPLTYDKLKGRKFFMPLIIWARPKSVEDD